MRKLMIIFTVVFGLMAALMLAACGGSASTESADSTETTEAADTAGTTDATEAATSDADSTAASDGGSTGQATQMPADHEGRTADMCPACHLEGAGGAPVIPDDHLADGQIDSSREQCTACHRI